MRVGLNQSILKEISPECHWKDWCWSWNFKTLATWWERTDSLEKTLTLGKTEGGRRRRRQRMRWLDSITHWMDMNLSKLRGVGDGQGSLAYCSSWGSTWLSAGLNWTETCFLQDCVTHASASEKTTNKQKSNLKPHALPPWYLNRVPASLQRDLGERGVSERAEPTWPLRAPVSPVARSAVISAYVASLWLAGGAGRPEREVRLRPSRLGLLGWPRRSPSWNCRGPGLTKSAAGQRAADSF